MSQEKINSVDKKNKLDKKESLVIAAKELMHHQGFDLTTLAKIAQKAGVPLGNVYYYFKTKKEIAIAVINLLSSEIYGRLNTWNTLSNPISRLYELLDYEASKLSVIAMFGCPIGGLCQELARQGGDLGDAVSALLKNILSWVEDQFKEANIKDAELHAYEFISVVQGIALLTLTFKDNEKALSAIESIKERIEILANTEVSLTEEEETEVV